MYAVIIQLKRFDFSRSTLICHFSLLFDVQVLPRSDELKYATYVRPNDVSVP